MKSGKAVTAVLLSSIYGCAAGMTAPPPPHAAAVLTGPNPALEKCFPKPLRLAPCSVPLDLIVAALSCEPQPRICPGTVNVAVITSSACGQYVLESPDEAVRVDRGGESITAISRADAWQAFGAEKRLVAIEVEVEERSEEHAVVRMIGRSLGQWRCAFLFCGEHTVRLEKRAGRWMCVSA